MTERIITLNREWFGQVRAELRIGGELVAVVWSNVFSKKICTGRCDGRFLISSVSKHGDMWGDRLVIGRGLSVEHHGNSEAYAVDPRVEDSA